MSTFKVFRKSDGEEVIRYSAAMAQEVNGFDLIDYDHTEYNPDEPVPAPTSRILTKLEYLRRFTPEERVTIREAAKTNPVLADYLAMMELAEEINAGDADTIAAVNLLEAVGLIGAGRANEVLYGQ